MQEKHDIPMNHVVQQIAEVFATLDYMLRTDESIMNDLNRRSNQTLLVS